MLHSGIYFNFYGCYGHKNGQQNRLKIEKSLFCTKFKAKYKKKTFKYVVCCDNSHHLFFFFFFFWYLLVLYINRSVKCLKCAPKKPISCFQPILAVNFNTIATVKVKNNARYLHLGYCSNKLMGRKC